MRLLDLGPHTFYHDGKPITVVGELHIDRSLGIQLECAWLNKKKFTRTWNGALKVIVREVTK